MFDDMNSRKDSSVTVDCEPCVEVCQSVDFGR